MKSSRAHGVPIYKIDLFSQWLHKKGAEILKPTNDWEILRFRFETRLGIVYINAKERTAFVGEAVARWQEYKESEEF